MKKARRGRKSAPKSVYRSPIAGLLDELSDDLLERIYAFCEPGDLLAVARARCVAMPRLFMPCGRGESPWLLNRIASQCSLTHASKQCYAFVMSEARGLFDTAFERLGERLDDVDVPSCPTTMTLPQWATMLFPAACTVRRARPFAR